MTRRSAAVGADALRRKRVAAAALVLTGTVAATAVVLLPVGSAIALQCGAGLMAALVVIALPRAGGAGASWTILAIGLTLWAGSAAADALLWGGRPDDVALPSGADPTRLLGMAFVALALAAMARRRERERDLMSWLDTAITGVGAGVVVTVFLLPRLAEHDTLAPGSAAQIVTLTAAAIIVLLLSAVTRLALTGAVKLASGRFLLAGSGLLLAGEALWRLRQLGMVLTEADALVRALLVLGPALLAAAAMHPSGERMGEVEHRSAHDLPRPRLALLLLAACSGPLCALLLYALHEPVDGLVVGVDTAIVLILVVLRLELVLREGRSQSARDLIVRNAAAALSAARDLTTVQRAVVLASQDLVGAGLRFLLFVTENERGARTVEEVLCPDGVLDLVATGISDLLEHAIVADGRPVRVLADDGAELVIAPISCRLMPRALVVLAGYNPLPLALDDSLHLLGTQAGLAIDSVLQAEELDSKRSEVRLQQIVRHASDAIIVVGRDRRIRYQTPSVVRILGYLPIDLDGAPLERLAHPDHWVHFASFLEQLVNSPHEAVRTSDVQLIRADDSVIQAEVVGSNLLDNIDVRGLVLTVRDVSGRRMLEDQLRHQAFHDALTGLANRALFIDRVEHALERVRRSDSSTPAVAFIDLDDFKNINDTLGHGAGDELLCAVAERLRRCLRTGDTPARLGGDEFAVLVEDAPDPGQIIEVAERVLDALREPIAVEGHSVHVSASIGIATRLGSHTTSADLLRNADLAMYTAKQNGKRRIEIFEPDMSHRAVDRQSLRADLEQAIDSRGLSVHFQPIIELASGDVVAFEALARWHHDARGPVSPLEFIPMAEDSGLIVSLGRQVLEQACQQLAAWHTANPGHSWRVAVNLTARQLLAPDLVAMVHEAAEEAGLEPSALEIEVTEAVLLADSERVLGRLERLKEIGVRIAIDDFGTGYSSISYLRRVPFDTIKIDRTFVSALQVEAPGTTLVRTIIDLAHSLGRPVVAEGVEQQVELDGLRQLGCEFGQGYLLGAPADAATLQRTISNLEASA